MKNFQGVNNNYNINNNIIIIIIIKKKKRNCRIVEFAVQADHRVKLRENNKRDKYLDLDRELKKTVENERDGDINYNWCTRYSQQRIDTETRELGKKRMRENHPNNSLIEIGQGGPGSDGDEGVLYIPQSPASQEHHHPRTLVGGVLTPLQRCSRCILQPQPNGQERERKRKRKRKGDRVNERKRERKSDGESERKREMGERVKERERKRRRERES